MSFLDEINADFAASLEQQALAEKAPAVTATVEHVLEPCHIQYYLEKQGSLQTAAEDVQKLRARHHSVARLLALGVPEGVVAEITGYQSAYISTLKNSPSMQELLSHYRAPGNNAAQQIAENLRTVGTAALERLMQRIEADELGDNELISAAKLGLDRSGHGPQSTVHSINEHRIVDEAELIKLAQDARRRDSDRILPMAKVREVLPAPEKKAEDELGG